MFGIGPQQYNPSQFTTTAPDQSHNLFMQGQQQQQLNQQGYQNQLGLNQQQFGYNNTMLNEQLANQTQLANLGAATQRQGFASNQQIASTQAQAAELPAQLQQQRFNTVWPFVSGTLGNAMKGGMPNFFGGGPGGPGGGTGSTPSGGGGSGAGGFGQPKIGANPVYTPGQIQQQVNLQRSANDQGTATKVRSMQSDLAGRGFGSNSPLSQALGQGLQMGNLATNTANETQTRLGAAGANAQQVLAGQTAQEQQFANRQDEAIKRGQVYQQYLSSALSALGSMG